METAIIIIVSGIGLLIWWNILLILAPLLLLTVYSTWKYGQRYHIWMKTLNISEKR